jgi:hypothetical protein
MSKADALASSKVPGPDDLWVVAPHDIPYGPVDDSDHLFPCKPDPPSLPYLPSWSETRIPERWLWDSPPFPISPWKNNPP